MPEAAMETNGIETEQETARLAALAATRILDSEPEAPYDAITRLCAEYFSDTVLLGLPTRAGCGSSRLPGNRCASCRQGLGV